MLIFLVFNALFCLLVENVLRYFMKQGQTGGNGKLFIDEEVGISIVKTFSFSSGERNGGNIFNSLSFESCLCQSGSVRIKWVIMGLH